MAHNTYYLDMEPDRKMDKYWGNGFSRQVREKARQPARRASSRPWIGGSVGSL